MVRLSCLPVEACQVVAVDARFLHRWSLKQRKRGLRRLDRPGREGKWCFPLGELLENASYKSFSRTELGCLLLLLSCSTHITWDEETIAEHDKYRGTRQKVGREGGRGLWYAYDAQRGLCV